MFQSWARAPVRSSTRPVASFSTARTGVLPKLVRLTTWSAATAKPTEAGSVTSRGTPGCSWDAVRLTV